MNRKIKINMVIILAIIAWAAYTLYPVGEKINLGLDLMGGMDLVYEIDVPQLKEIVIENKAMQMRRVLNENEIMDYSVQEYPEDLKIDVRVYDSVNEEQIRYLSAQLGEDEMLSVESGNLMDGISFVIPDEDITDMNQEAVQTAVEVIRNRIDLFGVTEPSINAVTGNRIRIQLPGESSSDMAQTIGSTAMLEFKLVREESGYVESVSERTKLGNIDENTESMYYGKRNQETGKTPVYVLERETLLSGTDLTEARVGRDELGRPIVMMRFNSEGTQKFARITRDNVNRQLAIVLDDIVMSAPAIQGAIPGGKAQIEGNFSEDEARELSIVLQAGALPAPLKKVSEISVGPSLGQESIERGVRAAAFGAVLVFVYILYVYKFTGIIASLGLILNIVLLMAGMALFRATLTLPGIAGIILIIGISVDANVIIFERIKEELKTGKTLGAAVDGGFDKAFSTIFDSNVTTILTALILYNFGTGPVKGFAITLIMGTVINLFTAVYVVKTIFKMLTINFKIKKLSI
ncbi:MAG: protein translocase subunit SecD [Candidatus Muiribacteriota bacterium]